MMKFIFFLILFLFVIRVLRRLFLPPQSRKKTTFTYRSSFNQYRPNSNVRSKDLDRIEEADFEEIEDKNTKKE